MTTVQRPFRFDVVAGPPQSGAAWLDTARRIEALGYDGLLLPDTAFTPSPFPALAAAAAATTALRVATWVLAAPLRTPGATVRETAALQLLSDGRFELGIGTGRPGAAQEAQRLGAAWGSAADRRDQLLAVVTAVRAEVRPAPPVLIAASGPKALALAAIGDAVALALPPEAGIDEVVRAVDLVRASGADPELALQLVAIGGRPVRYLADRPQALEGAAALTGGPEAMAEQLIALRAATGVSRFPIALEHAEDLAPVAALLRDKPGASGQSGRARTPG
jgi:alkanesulfonate monooxygenase SsuD/methylene tetrahydromethanopterin reductase-like flavin-dependent oxidoreductase (luciferase family)